MKNRLKSTRKSTEPDYWDRFNIANRIIVGYADGHVTITAKFSSHWKKFSSLDTLQKR